MYANMIAQKHISCIESNCLQWTFAHDKQAWAAWAAFIAEIHFTTHMNNILLAISISHLSYNLQQLRNNNNEHFKCKPKRYDSNRIESKRNESSRIGWDFHPVLGGMSIYMLNEMNFNIYLYFIGFFIHFTVKQQLKLNFLCIPL